MSPPPKAHIAQRLEHASLLNSHESRSDTRHDQHSRWSEDPNSEVSPSDFRNGMSSVSEDMNSGVRPSSLAPLPKHLSRQRSAHAHTETLAVPTVKVQRTWLPYTLRLPFIIGFLVFVNALLLAIISLHVYSTRNHGLINDKTYSSVAVFSRFGPTLLAVVFVLCSSIMLDDVKRTEAFARLAALTGAPAKVTINQNPGPWWKALSSSFSNHREGRRKSLTMLCAVVAYVLGFLLVAPFSATLLGPQDVAFPEHVPFRRVAEPTASPMELDTTATTYFRTFASILQKVNTSAWVTDKYVFWPTYPSSIGGAPLGPILTSTEQSWHQSTQAFTINLSCEPMTLTSKPHFVNLTWRQETDAGVTYDHSEVLPSITLSTKSGCTYQIKASNGSALATNGGAWWSDMSSFSIVEDDGRSFLLAKSSNCPQHGQLIFYSTPWIFVHHINPMEWDKIWANANFKVAAHVCTAKAYSGTLPVEVTNTGDGSVVAVDGAVYEDVKTTVDQHVVDVNALERVFLDANFSDYLFSVDSTRMDTRGPANLLAASYNFDAEAMLNSSSIPQEATGIMQRFFGESMMTSFGDYPSTQQVDSLGQIVTTRRRVVVSHVVAYLLEAVLFIQILLLCSVAFCSHPSRRPLNLPADPAQVDSVATLISEEANTRSSLVLGRNMTLKRRKQNIKHNTYRTQDNTLCFLDAGTANRGTVPNRLPRWRGPKHLSIIRLWPLLMLTTFLVLVFVIIAVLFWYSKKQGLYQTAFVYQTSIEVGLATFGMVSPAAVITTLVAVIIGLWWGSIESTMRRIQPFVSLASGPRSPSDGISLSFQSSYLAWAAFRAAKRRHLMLSTICMGAFLAQILTIAMSALFQLTPGSISSGLAITRKLELRQIAIISPSEGATATYIQSPLYGQVIANLYNDLATNWMYSAAAQLSFNGSEPPWSSMGWSFVPVDLSDHLANKSVQDLGAGKAAQDDLTGTPRMSKNISLQTPALRARLNCRPIEALENPANWLTEQDMTNATRWDVIANPKSIELGYELGCGSNILAEGNDTGAFGQLIILPDISSPGLCAAYNYTSFFANPAQIRCCENVTDEHIGGASIGFWSMDLGADHYYPLAEFVWPVNFTVKWIHGLARGGYARLNEINETQGEYPDPGHLIWSEPPSIAALSCTPIIEAANASVVVDTSSGRVREYTIVDDPVPQPLAWADPMVPHLMPEAAETLDQDYNNEQITTSYGVYFVDALLGAADLRRLAFGISIAGYEGEPESLNDHTFTLRSSGLNVDYMSYAMLALTSHNHTALLDATTLEKMAQLTFSTFFQHYVSSNVSTSTGGWAYQTINASQPADLGPVRYIGIGSKMDTGQDPFNGKHAPRTSTSYTNRTVDVTVSTPVEILEMSPAAFYICEAILAFLILATILLAINHQTYIQSLPTDLDCVADVAILVAGSDKLLKYIRERGLDSLRGQTSFGAGLGWFLDEQGEARWGIELVHPVFGAEWLGDGKADKDEEKMKRVSEATEEESVLFSDWERAQRMRDPSQRKPKS